MESKLTIEDLPDVVILDIFSYLSVDDITNRAQFVCRRWQELSRSGRLWNNYHYVPSARCSTREITELLSKMPGLKSFSFNERVDFEEITNALCIYCKEIKNLTCIGVEVFPQEELIRLCNNLRRLEYLSLSCRVLCNDRILEALQNCPKLFCLKYTYMADYLDEDRRDMMNIKNPKNFRMEHLRNLEAYTPFGSPVVENLIKYNADHLVSLKLLATYYELTLQVQKCEKLEVLVLDFASRPCQEVKAILSGIAKLKQLKCLSIRSLVDGNKSSLCSLFAKNDLPNLTELDIPHCMNFSMEVATNIVQCCPYLRVLKLQACSNFEDEHLITLVRCRDLQVLDISGCNRLTKRSLVYIPQLHYLHTLVFTWIPDITRPMFEALSGSTSLHKVYLDHCGLEQGDVIRFANRTLNLKHLSLYKCKPVNPTSLQQALRTIHLCFSNKPPWPPC